MLAGDRGRLRLFRGFSGLVADRLVVSRSASPALVEQYRHLAATLHHAQLSQGLRTLMVTSARPREGKTLTATNMALILAESYGRKVLLIDADLRRPSLHETFQLPNVSGLNEGLKAESDEKLALLEISEGLTLLPAGRPDPDPLSGLSSPRMKKIIGEAAAMFDWVIVDTPPVGLIADANIIAGMVDATLLVVRAGVTPYKEAESAVATLGRARVLGIVLNGIELDHAAARDYYYRHYQAPGDREREAR
jgi:capsular exopolysaccharide synthesis family protein